MKYIKINLYKFNKMSSSVSDTVLYIYVYKPNYVHLYSQEDIQ